MVHPDDVWYSSFTMDDTHTIFVRPPVWAILTAVLLGGLFFTWGKSIESRDHTPTVISVSGEGKAYAAPDIGEVTLGVQTGRQGSAKEAMRILTERMNAVMDAVKAQGVAEKDIKTEQLSLNPAYDWKEGTQIARGFEASQMLRVKVRDLDKVSEVLTAATNAGANQSGGVSFTIDKPEAIRAQARQEAIAQAQEKAVTLAKQLRMKLGRIRSFDEGGGGRPPMPMMMAKGLGGAMDMAEESLPVPAGEQEVLVNVNLVYELK